MKRLTEPTIGCFSYDLKDFKHKIGEFNDYDAFYAYSMALRRLGFYEDLDRTPEELAADLAELNEYRKKGRPEELEKVVRCGECKRGANCANQHILHGYCGNGERNENDGRAGD